MKINLIEMTNLVILGLTVIFSLTLAGNFQIHLSLPDATMDQEDSGSDFGSGNEGWEQSSTGGD